MSLLDTRTISQPFEGPPKVDHVLVMDRGRNSLPWSDWLAHECTSTFTRQIEHALDVLREFHPRYVLLNIDAAAAGELTLIDEAVGSGARVIVVGPPDADFLDQRPLRQPAVEYLSRPVISESLRAAMEARPAEGHSGSERVHVAKEKSAVFRFGPLPTQCSVMRRIVDEISRVAPTSVTVMLTGESGTGKEIAAQTIHGQSRRRDKPFIPINCGAISPQLIESELFGHEKGSFTGAVKEHRGVFERAHGGTLFLDEIAEMPVDLQVKLLRVLETHQFVRLGSDREQTADVRIIAATNRCPQKEVEEGRLRADLLYRIQVFPIYLPPLRQREGDVALLAEHFLAELNQEEGWTKRFSPESLEALKSYSWPGNIRELKNIVQRAYIMSDQTITAQSLPAEVLSPSASVRQSGSSLTVHIGSSVAEVEKNLIVATLDQCGGKKEKAAGVLGVSVKTLYNRLREYEENTLGSSKNADQEIRKD